MFNFISKKESKTIDTVPNHIGIIMDGNGRWAKKRLQPRVFGHKAGMDALQNVTIEASRLGVKVLTVYAFSTENWSRPDDEVSFIMNLPVEFFDKYVPELHANNVRVEVIGELDRLPKPTLDALNRAIEKTKANDGLILNFALNYGGRSELISAIKQIAQEVSRNQVSLDDIDEAMVSQHLFTSHLPTDYQDPDLIIRTSGELRLSNFLPWQSAYSEFYFTDTFWPDFDGKALEEAIVEYNQRHRRFGGV
jgi:undecaprenyl diphosphate synthase